jgi:D-alanyl-D-alanine carboxypeptidase
MRFLLLALVLGVGASATARADRVDDYVTAQMDKQHIPGVSIAVLKNGKAVKVKGYGFANLEHDARATPETVYEIGSISKQLIAAGILRLNEAGKVDLDDSARKYLEDAPESWQAITVRHLLTHTSGLVRETPGFQVNAQTDIDVIRAAYSVPLSFLPGENFQYSNIGYSVLAEIITRAAKEPWPQYMHEHVFAPLGMRATRTTTVEDLVPRRATGHVWADGKYQNAQEPLGVRPSGAFLSTVRDLAKWDAALYSDQVFSAQQRELMWTPAKLNDGSTKPYGFGWEIGKIGPHRLVHHAGTMWGFRSDISRFVDDRLTVVVLTNVFGALPEKISAGVASFYIPDLQPTRHATKLSAAALDACTGKYQLASGVLTVSRREDKLALTMAMGTRSMEMAVVTPESKTRFFDEDNPRPTYVFDTDAAGRMRFVIVSEQGKEGATGLKLAEAP